MSAPERTIVCADLSSAWTEAVELLLASPGQETFGLLIRIADPLTEVPAVRAAVDRLLARRRQRDVNEVANTIFPREWAHDLPEPSDLAADYRAHYPLLRQIDGANARGTYFGRLIAYPSDDGDYIDQLSLIVEKLRQGVRSGRLYRASYQLNVYHPSHDSRIRLGFPCLAHLGLQVDGERRLHALADYRSHDVATKGYGNYLGLAGLLAYVAAAADLRCGVLTLICGRAFLGQPLSELRLAQAAIAAA